MVATLACNAYRHTNATYWATYEQISLLSEPIHLVKQAATVRRYPEFAVPAILLTTNFAEVSKVWVQTVVQLICNRERDHHFALSSLLLALRYNMARKRREGREGRRVRRIKGG